MRKADLYDFIEIKIAKAKRESYKVITEFDKTIREEAEKEFLGLDNILRNLKNASDSMDKVKLEHKTILFDHWQSNNNINSCNNAMAFKKNVIDRLRDIALWYVKENSKNGDMLRKEYYDFYQFLESIKPEYVKEVKKLADLDKLEIELKGVVKGSKSAKDAYKNLVALNVNMSGFEEANTTLPAVQKLSVDVCLVNGDCEGN